MHLLENRFENAGLMRLAPNARDVAEQLLILQSLESLLTMLQENQADKALLAECHVADTHWPDIVKAALLAKTTYFVINPDFSTEEILFLMKAACISIDRPLEAYTIKEIIKMSQTDYPIFSQWLSDLAQLLKAKTLDPHA